MTRPPAPRPVRIADRRAIGILLALADGDQQDAALLVDGGRLRNGATLAESALRSLIAAVVVSEAGWDGAVADDLAAIPDANPLKPRLAAVQSMMAWPPPALLADGRRPALPGKAALREALAALASLVAVLAAYHDVDLASGAPADNGAPLRPAPPAVPRAQVPRMPAIQPVVEARTSTPVPHPVAPSTVIHPATRAATAPSTQFWALMDQWGVADLPALALLGHAGGLTKAGTRPRFKLATAEADQLAKLREIDAALTTLGTDPSRWLRTPIKAAPFLGATPLAFLTDTQAGGARDVGRFVLQQGLRRSMRGGPLEQDAGLNPRPAR